MKNKSDEIESALLISEIARRQGFAPQTVSARILAAGIVPDFELFSGSRRSYGFFSPNVLQINALLQTPKTKI